MTIKQIGNIMAENYRQAEEQKALNDARLRARGKVEKIAENRRFEQQLYERGGASGFRDTRNDVEEKKNWRNN